MFTSSTFVLAVISVLAHVAVATPPACLIGAVGAQANPADMKTLCGSGAMAVEGNITSLCTGDASSQAMSIFSSTCLAAGVTISVSSSTASSTSTTGSGSATTAGSISGSGSTGFTTATATGSSASGESTSHSSSKGSSSTSTAASSSASGSGTTDSAGFSTSPEHALYLTPIFLGALAYFL